MIQTSSASRMCSASRWCPLLDRSPRSTGRGASRIRIGLVKSATTQRAGRDGHASILPSCGPPMRVATSIRFGEAAGGPVEQSRRATLAAPADAARAAAGGVLPAPADAARIPAGGVEGTPADAAPLPAGGVLLAPADTAADASDRVLEAGHHPAPRRERMHGTDHQVV